MKIAAWNVEGRLTRVTKKRRGTPEQILGMIEQINADVFILPEAYIGEPDVAVNRRLQDMGYEWRDAQYSESDRDPPSDLHIRILSRFKILESTHVRWGNVRGLVAVVIHDPKSRQDVRFIATHLDERSDKRRLAQLNDAVIFINSSNLPTIMLGDFNAMHDDSKSKFVRSRAIKSLSALIPHKKIQERVVTLMEMASGVSLKFLESKTNLIDIDPRHLPTTTPKLKEMEWMPSVKMAQIDHIFVSPHFDSTHFTVYKDAGSDHRAISANITIKSL